MPAAKPARVTRAGAGPQGILPPLVRIQAGLLLGLIALAVLLSLMLGPTAVGPAEVWEWLRGHGDSRTQLVVMQLRLPRTLLALGVGGALGLSGALLQGLFRNPLADPGLIGVSSGAAVGASVAIGFGAAATAPVTTLAAFLCGTLAVACVWRIARTAGQVSVERLLLAGIAINALCGAVLGMVLHIASDEALRSLTSFTLGALGGASLTASCALLAVLVLASAAIPWFARRLDALILGDEGARSLGVDVAQLKVLLVLLTAFLVGICVALSGLIGFIGLVAPHLVRIASRPLHGHVLPGAVLLGALLLLGADILARTVAAPQELPVGVLTALLGGPFFLLLMARSRGQA